MDTPVHTSTPNLVGNTWSSVRKVWQHRALIAVVWTLGFIGEMTFFLVLGIVNLVAMYYLWKTYKPKVKLHPQSDEATCPDIHTFCAVWQQRELYYRELLRAELENPSPVSRSRQGYLRWQISQLMYMRQQCPACKAEKISISFSKYKEPEVIIISDTDSCDKLMREEIYSDLSDWESSSDEEREYNLDKKLDAFLNERESPVALRKPLLDRFNRRKYLEPHADDIIDETSGDDVFEQNVNFEDSELGYMADITSTFDEVRMAPFVSDATLDDFFSRPIKIQTIDWTTSTTVNPFLQFNPWKNYFENKRVSNRISNYKLLMADLHVKVVINGNQFYYGMGILSYNPLQSLDTMTTERSTTQADIVAASQRPHIYIDPTTSLGGEMKLPFFYYKNAMDIPGGDWDEMGQLSFHAINQLKHANNATGTVNVAVFAWATNVKVAIPTETNASGLSAQADEYQKRPVSNTAGAIARAANWLTRVPMIRPFARATEIGANAVGAIASIFGYSAPPELEASVYKPDTKNNFALTNVRDDTHRLTVDAKQELTVDPRTVGLDATDEMAITNIAQKETYLHTFAWDLDVASESLLWNCVVDPGVHRQVGSGTLAEYHFTAPAFACMPFQFWRGTMKFRFRVVCSQFHKGRIKVVYDPTSGQTNAEYNTAYTTVVDIAEQKDFTIDVGWGQPTSYRESLMAVQNTGFFAQSLFMNSSLLAYSNTARTYGNGVLSVYVVNELTAPTATNNSIEINVFVSMCDDFEVAAPTQEQIRFWSLNLPITARRLGEQPTLEPQADEDDLKTAEADESRPSKPGSLTTKGNMIPLGGPINHIHFGEVIGSYRQLVKRYSALENLPLGNATTADPVTTEFRRSAFPRYPGYQSTRVATPNAPAINLGTLNTYSYMVFTMLHWVTAAYGGWRGSIRYFIDYAGMDSEESANIFEVTRTPLGANANVTSHNTFSGDMTTAGGQSSVLPQTNQFGASGVYYQTRGQNHTASWEVPYYSNYRFTPAKRTPNYVTTTNDPYQSGYLAHIWQTDANARSHQWARIMVAAGEDFSTFFYLGPPIYYRIATTPSS